MEGVEVQVLGERVQYYDADGKLVTRSFRAFSGENVRRRYLQAALPTTIWRRSEGFCSLGIRTSTRR